MMIRTGLSDKARAELIAFCARNLKPGLDPARYADNYDIDLGEPGGSAAVFEIPARDCIRGHVVSTSFGADEDFRTEEVDD
ncbi:hypothetical protein [Paracoccus versutus]|uniref:hypothetical protein n=1 Tax=Paracoccus versutus TaxID=34007 RepID=UPI000DF81253|nr:hypothetical protein [Paracoccus versutus]RDD69199.1 hypothetical protein DVR11_22505 [Paracoccus versutus]